MSILEQPYLDRVIKHYYSHPQHGACHAEHREATATGFWVSGWSTDAQTGRPEQTKFHITEANQAEWAAVLYPRFIEGGQ